jgi:hypothetical protein
MHYSYENYKKHIMIDVEWTIQDVYREAEYAYKMSKNFEDFKEWFYGIIPEEFSNNMLYENAILIGDDHYLYYVLSNYTGTGIDIFYELQSDKSYNTYKRISKIEEIEKEIENNG